MKVSYKHLFQCPSNYSLDSVVCTTMSIDASAAVNLIATAMHPDLDPLNMTQSQLTVLTNAHAKGKFYFFYDKTKPIKNETISYPEECLAPVLRQAYSVECENVFHPKIILARFICKDDSSKIRWRLMVSSHNLTLSDVYEVGIILDSQKIEIEEKISPNHNLHDLFRYIKEKSSCTDASFKKQIDNYASELENVNFMDENQNYTIELAVLGVGKTKRPKLFEDLYNGIINQKDQWLIVSPVYETGKEFQKDYRIFGPLNSSETSDKFRPTHAKMYIHHTKDKTAPVSDQLLIGSSNCSVRGLNHNIECLVKVCLAKNHENDAINQNKAFFIENLDLTRGKESFCFNGTTFKRVEGFTELSYEGLNILRDIIESYEFSMGWGRTRDGKPKAYVYITEKDAKSKYIEDEKLKLLKILPYSMPEENSATAKQGEKWEVFRKGEINFIGKKETRKTNILRLRYKDSFNTQEILWYDAETLIKSDEILENQLTKFFQVPYTSLFSKDQELYWGEFWHNYKTFCTVYKNDIGILNKLDKLYRNVWATYCTFNEEDSNANIVQLPAALNRHTGLMPYQESAIEQVVESFASGIGRFLVADETGLGKTYIAQGVGKRLFEKWKGFQSSQVNAKGETFNIAYFGSNLFLLDKTAEKLMRKPNGLSDVEFNKIEGVDRFSMMLGAFENLANSKLNITKADNTKINLFMLSANLIGDIAESKSEEGNDAEREFREEICKIESYKELKNKSMKEFRENIAKVLKDENKINLLILDEFHRYDSNVRPIIEILASDNTKVLLLSATPYNWYSSIPIEKGYFIENENTGEESNKEIQTFSDVLKILGCDENSKAMKQYNEYKETYTNYKKGSKKADIEERINDASNELRKYVWCNERIYGSDNKRHEIPGSEALSGPEWQEALKGQLAAMNSQEVGQRYRALFPGVYSFAIKNLVVKKGKEVYKELNGGKPENKDDNFLFDNTNKLKVDLLRKNLRTESIRRLQVEPMKRMLWITPSNTMYQPSEPFIKDATKLLIFSAYKMVPRGIASIFSSYVGGADEANLNTEIVGDSIDQIKKLDEIIRAKGLLPYINDKYIPNYSGKTINLSWDKFKEQFAKENAELLNYILDTISNEIEISSKVLAMYILSAPLPGLYRIFLDEFKSVACAEKFYDYFTQEGIKKVLAMSLWDLPGKNGLEKLLNYCGAGCLQDMLIEYFALMKNKFEKSLKTVLTYSGSKVYVLNKNTYKIGVGEGEIRNDYESWAIKCRFADRFTPDGSDTGVSATSQDGMKHQKSVQEAFNSPFWPMILSTTSAGQEGIDLDSYCRRIMHYSVPNSPMAFEQRDGRIDRRMSLASRQRMTRLWGNTVCLMKCTSKDYWESLYSQCLDNSGISPLWSMREDIDYVRIERLIPFVPQSDEELAYRRLVDLKMRYRRAFGKPDEHGGPVDEFNLKLNEI